MGISLAGYANDREYVVAFVVSIGCPMGAIWPLGDPDFALPEGFDACDLRGEIDPAEKGWIWDGTGTPTDYQRNAITRITASSDKTAWKSLTSGG